MHARACLVTDVELVAQHSSRNLYDVLKIQPGEAIGKNVADLCRCCNLQPPPADFAQRVLDNARAEALVLPQPGQPQMCPAIQIEAHVLCADDAAPAGMVLWLSNATQATRQMQAHKIQAMSRFAGTVAHDMNNHLTVIKGHCDLLGMEPDLNDDVRESIQQIEQAYDNARAMTAQLMHFSGRDPLNPQPVDPDALIESMQNDLPLANGVELSLDLARVGQAVLVDPDALRDAVTHLVNNAVEAMPHGGQLHIATSSTPEGKHVGLSVRDTGTGIEPDVLPHVFEPYVSTRHKGKGTGIGLSMVHSFASRSNAQVDIITTPGEGTTVQLSLPVQTPTTTAAGDASPSPADAVTEHSDAQDRPAGPTILVIDDNDAVRRLMVRILQYDGYDIVAATTAQEAIEQASALPNPPAVLIIDVMMPDGPGPKLAEHLTSLFPHLRVLYVSGYTRDVVEEHGVSAADAFLRKPFSPKDLSRRVAELLDDRLASAEPTN